MITNETGISLAMSVWLVNDDYDYRKEENYISATSLMKPIRQLVLPHRIPKELKGEEDVEAFIPRALGNSIHDSVEKAWTKNYVKNLTKLGYSQEIIDRVLVNPTPEQLAAVKDPIPVYVEQRALKKVKVGDKTWTVGGKFDLVTDGTVQDIKSTTAYSWLYGGKDDDYKLQGSLYRWLNPDKITEDFVRINFVFTDWQKSSAKTNPKYPQQRVEHKDITLLDITDTDKWVKDKLGEIQKYWAVDEKKLPRCSDEELWMSDPKFKYYADPAKTAGRSTKNFDKLAEAKAHMAEKGGKGIIITELGEPKRCDYCEGFEACTQKDEFPKYQQL